MFSSPVKHVFKIMFVTKKSVITTASKCIKQQFKAPVKKKSDGGFLVDGEKEYA